jgi:hypothetical protein
MGKHKNKHSSCGCGCQERPRKCHNNEDDCKCHKSDNHKHHHGHYSTQKEYVKTNKGYELRQHPYDRCNQSSAYAMFNPFYGIECHNYQLYPFVRIPGQYRLPMLKADGPSCGSKRQC